MECRHKGVSFQHIRARSDLDRKSRDREIVQGPYVSHRCECEWRSLSELTLYLEVGNF
jgi:hypothetical protein